MKHSFACPDCELLWAWFYDTNNEAEIKEALEKEINSNLKLCWKTVKKMAKEKPKEVIDYLLRIDPFDTTTSELNDGFIREPKTDEEWKEALLYYSDDTAEWGDIDMYDYDGGCKTCEKYIASQRQGQTQ